MTSNLSTDGIWSVGEQDSIPDNEDRRMFIGIVVVGGGIIPASISFFGSAKRFAAQSIRAAEFGGDDDDDEDESSFMKHISEDKMN